MDIRTDRGWVRAGLAVLVTGILGGGVLAVVGGPNQSRKVTADGVATGQPAAATPLAPARPREAPAGPDAPEVGDKVVMGDDGGSVTVSAVEDDVSAGRLFGAGEGFKYVAAEVKGCSGPNEKNITFEPSYFLLRLDDGTIRDSGPGAKKPSLEGGKIPAGKCLSGWVTFTVPDGALPTAVIYDGSSRTTWTVPRPKDAKQTTTTTVRAGATTKTTEDRDDSGDSGDSGDFGDSDDSDDPDPTSTTRSKASTTSTTRTKSTATTATTAKSTAKSTSSTSTTRKSAGSPSTSTTATTGKSVTSTTAPGKSSSTTTTGRSVESDPADSEG